MGEDSSSLSLGSEALCLAQIWLWVAQSCSETSLLFFRGRSCVVLCSGHIRLCAGTPAACTCCSSGIPTEIVTVSFWLLVISY